MADTHHQRLHSTKNYRTDILTMDAKHETELGQNWTNARQPSPYQCTNEQITTAI